MCVIRRGKAGADQRQSGRGYSDTRDACEPSLPSLPAAAMAAQVARMYPDKGDLLVPQIELETLCRECPRLCVRIWCLEIEIRGKLAAPGHSREGIAGTTAPAREFSAGGSDQVLDWLVSGASCAGQES